MRAAEGCVYTGQSSGGGQLRRSAAEVLLLLWLRHDSRDSGLRFMSIGQIIFIALPVGGRGWLARLVGQDRYDNRYPRRRRRRRRCRLAMQWRSGGGVSVNFVNMQRDYSSVAKGWRVNNRFGSRAHTGDTDITAGQVARCNHRRPAFDSFRVTPQVDGSRDCVLRSSLRRAALRLG